MNRNFYQKRLYPFIYPLLLAIITIFLILLILPEHSLFGSEGDWFSQHLAVAEQFRTIFYETGQILPDYSPAGAGSNIYDFSYYGLLRPDVLISFLLPKIPMAWILSAYAVLELAAGSILCCYWLKKHLSFPFFAFLGGVLYSCATCFYQAHHQIMFVNYMPFLLLALLGVDRLLAKRKHGLLTLSLALVYLHSYYFAPAVLAVVFLYFLQCLHFETEQKPEGGKGDYWLRLFFSIGISIGMAAVLLLPTGLDLLSTRKDAGIPPSLSEIFSIRLSMESLLYHPGGCGLSILCLYTLLLSIRRKSTRILSILLLACLTVNACLYLLSGCLYIRYKVLIPLVPLLLLLCTRTVELLFTRKEPHSLLCIILCLVPACFFEIPYTVLADTVWMAVVFAMVFLAQKSPFAKYDNLSYGSLESFAPAKNYGIFSSSGKKLLPLHLLLCLAPAILSIAVGRHDQFISASDTRQAVFSKKELEELELENSYRFDYLTEPFANVNVLPLQGMGSTAMYSSVTDSGYADFYYNIMRNPIRIRNRVALMTDANPFFAYLMGIRYIQAEDSHLPWGYEPIAQKSNTVIAENKQVLPTAYTSASLMEQEEYEKLEFPYTLEALTKYTVIGSSSKAKKQADASQLEDMDQNKADTLGTTAETFMETSRITPVSIETLTAEKRSSLLPDTSDIIWQPKEQGGTLSVSLKEEMQISVPLADPLEDRILICSFEVESPNHKEVTIDINGIRNKLSGSNAPYPNHNNTFTYLISSNQKITTLDITLKPGTYLLSKFQFWDMDTVEWGNSSIQSANYKETMGKTLFQGTSSCEKDSFFVTSFPFRKGYEALVDGKKVSIELVNEGFVGFPLPAGSHEITISHQPPGKAAAVAISLVSLLLFFVGILLENRAKHHTRVLS